MLGEANFSDHGANRLGASALMQGLCDGYFVIPYTIGNYLATNKFPKVEESNAAVQESITTARTKIDKLLAIKGNRTVDSFHRELGKIVWDYCGMARTAEGLEKAIGLIRALREEYWKNVTVAGSADDLNESLEKAGRVADYFELAELMCIDARNRNESCGGHFREEYQTPEGEAQRDDANYSYVAAWEYRRRQRSPRTHQGTPGVPLRSSQPEELQVNETDTENLAAEEQQRKRRLRPLPRGRRRPRDVDLGMPRRAERDPDPQG